MTAEKTASPELFPSPVPTAEKKPDAIFLLASPLFFFLLITYVLPPPLPIRSETNLLDPSWRIILTDAFLHGVQFGRDLVYTYGPWGFVAEPQGDPRIYPWLLAARLLIALAFAGGLSILALRKIRWSAGRFVFVAAVAALSDPIYVLPMVLLATESFPDRHRDRTSSVIVHLLAIACALTMWIKFTSFVTVGTLAGVLAVRDLIARRRPVVAAEIAGAALAFWLLARQSLFNIPAFLHGALSTAASYTTAMFLPGPYVELAPVAALLTAIAIPAAILLWLRRPGAWWPSLAWLALLFFLQLKESFVRYDPFHVWMGLVNAFLPCALILICRAGFFDPPRSYPVVPRILTRICAATVILISAGLIAHEVPSKAGFERYQALTQNMTDLRALLSGQSLYGAYRNRLEEFHRAQPLPLVPGTAAVFPDNQVLLYGNGIKPSLPPIPQSFEAYNAYLSGRNAAFFRGPRRPDSVYFDIFPIDQRYPTAQDTLSWLSLLDCYTPAPNPGPHLLLRASGCRGLSLDLIAETTAHAGQIISVPAGDDEPIWAEIDLRRNAMGAVVSASLRPPITLLAVRTGMGRKVYQFPEDIRGTGFLLSPLLVDPASFGRLYFEWRNRFASRGSQYRNCAGSERAPIV